MSKSKGVRVTFGHNSENVTGSYTLIECGESGKKILVDFGLIQENVSLLKEYQMNSKRPDFKPKDLTYVFFTHAHIDHCGRAAMLTNCGCTAPMIIPEGSKEIFKAMMLDSANIMTRDAEDLSKRLKKEYNPIYSEDDVFNTLSYLKEYPVGEKIKLDDDIEFKLTYNSHIFKSVTIIFWIKNGSQTRKIIITGDIGNLSNPQKFVEEFVPFENCNLLVGECTYADSKRTTTFKDRERDLEKIKATIDTICNDRKGRILIPAFSFGRSPSMLATLYDLYHEDENFNIPIIYASPLGIRLMKIYQKELDDTNKEYLNNVLSWKNIRLIGNFTELEKEVNDGKPKIIVCPSGFMKAGYSVFVGTQLLSHGNDCIMFCGYAGEGSLAWKIKQKKTKTITIDGKSIHARCQVCNLTSFSSHAQEPDLLDIYSQADIDKLALVHSNFDSKVVFAKKLQNQLSKRNKTNKVICVNKSTVINL